MDAAGFKLSSVKPLLILADELDALGVAEANADKVLPLISTAVSLAPGLLPLVGTAVKTPPATYFGGAAASAAAAFAAVSVIPDDSTSSIAVQTILVVLLGLVLPGAFKYSYLHIKIFYITVNTLIFII